LKAYYSPQNMAVLKHLRKVGPLTPLSALVNFGVARLASRIDELRKMGYQIKTTIKVVNKKRYASYSFNQV
jgi:hypothetical protein